MTDTPPTITTHIEVSLHGTSIDLDEFIDIATQARQNIDLSVSGGKAGKCVMRVLFEKAYPGEVGSHDTVTLIFEEA